jgi:two-component system LytT family response regulator
MKKIKAVIVDDEASAVETLRGMLGTFCQQVEILAEAHSVEDALLVVQQHQPDVVFLDIEMPPFCKGFDLLKMTPNRSFGVIFTTAYPQYAIQAINDVQPWGYLLKPFRVADLVQAVLVVEEKLKEDKTVDKNEPPEHQGIIIPDSRKGNMVIHSRDILYCQADGGTTDIFLLRSGKVEKITASFLLKEVEASLPPNVFCRTHHSYIVNMQHIIRYKRTGRNGIIYLPQNHQVDISVHKMEAFETQFRKALHKGL